MKASIFSYTGLIGTADLEVSDSAMGCVFGEFLPTELYYKNIQQSVWEINLGDKKWDELKLNVQLENGYFLFPAGFTISDAKESPDAPKRLEVTGIDSQILEDFFLPETPKPFVEGPWNALSISEKSWFEDELMKEIGKTKSRKPLLDFIRKFRRKHVLADVRFSALCRDASNDDVLFAILKEGIDKRFALVHLTWTGRNEGKDYPHTGLYSNFDEFKHSRMI